MDCKQEFTVIQIERLLLPVKWKINGRYILCPVSPCKYYVVQPIQFMVLEATEIFRNLRFLNEEPIIQNDFSKLLP